MKVHKLKGTSAFSQWYIVTMEGWDKEGLNTTDNWKYVTCKNCLKKRPKKKRGKEK